MGLTLTQEELGAFAGTTRESANRAVGELMRRGTILRLSRGRYLVRAHAAVRGSLSRIRPVPGTGSGAPVRPTPIPPDRGGLMRTPALHRRGITVAAVTLAVLLPAGTAFACGGLVAPNGTISLTRTTTLAAYHDGMEHYVTSFEFAGATEGEVGSIVPLPGLPTRVIKGGDWTLQRLVQETQPQDERARRVRRRRASRVRGRQGDPARSRSTRSTSRS